MIEENQKITGVIDVTPFIIYFAENVYGKFENREICVDVFDLFKQALSKGEITAKRGTTVAVRCSKLRHIRLFNKTT